MEPLAASDPSRIAGFTLLARLGAGGMGRVYLARSPGGRLAAVKVVHTHRSDDPRFRRRFRREAEAAKAVSGFYTAPVIGADPDSDPPWLATAHVPGPDLGKVIGAHGPLPARMVTALAAALAEALTAIHAAGLVHRDLKPSNILLAQDGPRVIDFGIVHAFDATEITQGLLGTPGYMSPEQAGDEEIGPASDVFSLGCVLLFALTGRPPFGTGRLPVLMRRLLTEPPDLTGVPAAHRSLITRCLARNPADRPTPHRLLEELEAEVTDHRVNWAAGPYATMIDDHAAEIAHYTAARTRLPPAPEPVEPRGPASPEPVLPPAPAPAEFPPVPETPDPESLTPEPPPSGPPAPKPPVTSPDRRGPRPPVTSPPKSRGRRFALAMLLTLGVATGAVALADRGGSGQGTGFRPWSVDGVHGPSLVADGLVYAGRSNGTAAYDARTGRRRWASASGGPEVAVGRFGDRLLVRSRDGLSGLDPASGARAWQVPLGEEGCVPAEPGPAGNLALLDEIDRQKGPDDLRISVIDPATGRQRWTRTVPNAHCPGESPDISGGRINIAVWHDGVRNLLSYAMDSGKSWRFTGDIKEIGADQENVYALVRTSDDRLRLHALAAGTGRARWRAPVAVDAASLDGSLATSGTAVFLLVAGEMHAFDRTNGSRLWRTTFPAEGYGELEIHDGTGYVGQGHRGTSLFFAKIRTRLSAVDLRTGRKLWTVNRDSRAKTVGADDGTVYLRTHKTHRFRPDGRSLIALDRRTGRERWRTDMTVNALATSQGAVYVVDGEELQAIDPSTGRRP